MTFESSIDNFSIKLRMLNPYLNPTGWTSHIAGDYSCNYLDNPWLFNRNISKFDKPYCRDLIKLFPALDLTLNSAENLVTKNAKQIQNKSKQIIIENSQISKDKDNFEELMSDRKIPENLTPKQRQDFIKNSTGLKIPSENSDNTGKKVAIGGTILAGTLICADLIFAKGKHISKLYKGFKPSKINVKNTLPKSRNIKTPNTSKTTPVKNQQINFTNSKKIKFRNINEAQDYFRNLNVDADLSKCSDLTHLEHVAQSLEQIKNMGVESQIKSLTYTAFDESSITKALAKRGLSRDVLPAGDISWAHGASEQGHIFLNPNVPKHMANGSNTVMHEVGHYHRNILKDSFRTKWNLENPDAVINHEDIVRNVANRSGQSVESVMQKLETSLHREVKAYHPAADENFADQFALLVENKKEFSNGAMLYYDMFGGARLPKKMINGLKYDEYMMDLYTDAENILLRWIK